MSEELRMMQGYILSVKDEREGTFLTADAPSGSTELPVDDVSPFNEDGGLAVVVREDASYRDTIEYDGVIDDDEIGSSLIGVSGLSFGYYTDDNVFSVPAATTRYASVVEAQEEAGILVRIPHTLYPYLSPSTKEYGDGTATRIEFFFDGSGYVAFDVLGAIPAFDAQYLINHEAGMRERTYRYKCDPPTTGLVGLQEIPGISGIVYGVRMFTKGVTGSGIGGASADFQISGATFMTVEILPGKRGSGLIPVEEAFADNDSFGIVQGDMSGISTGILYAEFRVRKDT